MPNRVGGQGSTSSVLTKPIDFLTGLFWSTINFFVVFFSTMLGQEPPEANRQTGGRGNRTGGGGGGGGGGGPGGRPRLRGMNDINKKAGPKMNVGGGG